MFGHYEYCSQHTIGGSSSETNVFGSLSQLNVVGSSSFTRHFSLDDDLEEMYSPLFSESFCEEWPAVEEVNEIQVPTPKKKPNRRRDQAKRKAKVGISSPSSATAVDVESLAKFMTNKYAMTNDPYKAKKGPGNNGVVADQKAGARAQGCGAGNLTNRKLSKI
nr:hypothetical protein [Tanacetum cinerariifolium]